MSKILVVEDEPDLLQMTVDYLKDNGYEVDGAESVSSALTRVSEQQFDLVVTDIFLGAERLGGIQILEQAQGKSLPVILISGNANMEAMRKAINLGARFFLEKPFALDNLKSVITEVLSDPAEMGQRIQSVVGDKKLTKRELEIFELLAKGLSNKDIAGATSTSERTVKAHISSIFKKCDVSSRAELLSLLLKQ